MARNKPNENKPAFLSMPTPASYVAGLGRGASGFTTRSDIGPAREGPSAEVIAEAQAQRGDETTVDQEQFQDPDDERGLIAGITYEQDDEEADNIYESVDRVMDSRRRVRREAREREELAQLRAERPKIQQRFSDLKRGLSAITDAEWESIPEVGNLTRKKRRKEEEQTYAIPDSVLIGDRAKNEYENSLHPRKQDNGTPLAEFHLARETMLGLKLDQIASAPSGTATSIDRKGYLTSLDSVLIRSEAEIGDIKRFRMLLDSLMKSNPKHAPGWIAAAGLEEHAGRMAIARKLINQGCEQCPKSEDVWLKAAELHNVGDAKIILANAVQHASHSVNIWLKAVELETDVNAAKRVLRKALEQVPNSVLLWKRLIKLELYNNSENARVLLSRAVEVIPLSVDLWIALARFETPARAKAVLNKARKAVPTSHEIWIAAGRLLEQEALQAEVQKSGESQEEQLSAVDKTIEAGVQQLRKHQVSLTREQWLQEAEQCETDGSIRTCEAIIKATISMQVEQADWLGTWIADAESTQSRGMIGTARAILAHALQVFPDNESLWKNAADLEKVHGTRESLEAVLSRAVEHCPKAEILWLMAAKERWIAGDIPGARGILERAFVSNTGSEQIWLAAVKLEVENNQFTIATELLHRAREDANTAKVWMKSAVFDRQQGQLKEALNTLAEAITRFPTFPKLYMIQGQIHQSQGEYSAARTSFAAGIKACPKEPALWILASKLEEFDNKSIKARAILEKARQVNPANEALWVESVGLEERSSSTVQAKSMLARALQDCPTSGLLWNLSIWAESRPMRKTKATDALKKTNDSPVVICAVARLFWADRKIEKARQWFGRAVAGEFADLGDTWGWWLRFERQHGTQDQQNAVRTACVAAEPHHGTIWQVVLKDMANVGKDTRQILEIVADKLE